MTMTAFEMASKFKWAIITVSFNFVGENYNGHVSTDGQIRVVYKENGPEISAIWIGSVCLTCDTIVYVEQTIGSEGAKIHVRSSYQNAA